MKITTSILVTFTSIAAAQQPIQFSATCQSISLSPALARYGALPATIYFTSYDGRTVAPMHDALPNNRAQLSGEMRPLTRSGSNYITDYVIIADTWNEWGSFGCTMPSTDIDRDGIPDWLDPDRSVNLNIPAGATIDYPKHIVTNRTCRIQRLAGQTIGQFVLDDELSGAWQILRASGSFTNRTQSLDGTITIRMPAGTNAVGRVIMRLAGASSHSIEIGPVFVFVGDSLAYQAPVPATLTRAGHEYRGLLTLIDGNTGTTWPDYRDWYVTITDPNDSDHDGTPDLSEIPAVRLNLAPKPDGNMTLTITPPEGLPAASKIVFLESPDLRAWTPVYTNTSAALWTYTPDPAQTTKFIRVAIHDP